MVKARIDLKTNVQEFIKRIDREFTTHEVRQYAQEIAPNVRTSVGMVAKYIQTTKAEHLGSGKWRVKTLPKEMQQGMRLGNNAA
jgi:hypothetical protein